MSTVKNFMMDKVMCVTETIIISNTLVQNLVLVYIVRSLRSTFLKVALCQP